MMLASALVSTASYVVVGRWIYQAHRNLALADLPDLQFTPAWAIWWYFIPFANLVKPFQAMRELWNASHRALGNRQRAAPGLLWLWWLGFILGGIGNFWEPEFAFLDIIGITFTIVSALALLIIINGVTAAQRQLNPAHVFT